MKSFKTISLCMLILFAAACSVGKNSVSQKLTLQQKIESKDFTFFVDHCLPTDLVNSSFNSDVIVKLKNGNAYGNLPFHGKLSVNPQEMTSGSISFDGPVKDFTMAKIPSKGWNLFFNIDNESYLYQVEMEISLTGKAVVKVSSTKRSTMTYFGDVD